MFLRLSCFVVTLFFVDVSIADNCVYGCPSGAQGQKIDRANYTLLNNSQTKLADWVAYQVRPSTIDGPTRNRSWRADPNISSAYTLEPSDYKDANATIGTDRGHQVPLASFSNTRTWYELNYLSNITPQNADLNQGSWVDLESAVRDLVRDSGRGVYVVTGPLYEYYFASLPSANERHRIPSGYFKVIITVLKGFVEASAFVMDQDIGRRDSHCWYETTVDEVEFRADINIMPALPSRKHYPVETISYGLSAKLGC